ncbi:acetyl-CoA synthetase-like protein [Sparassis latifolia]|uniref:Acyl-coenzyme A n=1 Tax=Sparassis crispa TaxID=139825 RepID=A0A401GR22_9APHY|nr:Putative acyl-coenzyme A [Sparassis crispa]GBE84164.1 Putative acyl-coenzyme A [Sparassis crispa]
MVIHSFYGPVPPQPDENVHTLLFEERPWPEPADFPLHIDGLTGETRTRQEFADRMYDSATALGTPGSQGGLGLGADGDIVGILSHNSLDYIVLMHSLLRIATPFALLSAHSTPFELGNSLRTSKATCLFVQPELLPVALGGAREAGLLEDRIYILQGSVPGRRSLADMILDVRARTLSRIPARPAKQDTLAYLVFSSGTTGLPKAVMISHGNIRYSLIQQDIALRAEDALPPVFPPPVCLAILPFYHTYGLHISCLRPLYTSSTHVIIPKWNVDLVLELIPKYQIAMLPLIPSAIHQLVHHKNIDKADFSSVMTFGSGAAYLPPDLMERFSQLLQKPHEVAEGYGSSEGTIATLRRTTTRTLNGRYPMKRGATGILIAGMSARIVRADGTDADVGEPGELWLSGGNVALGYFGNEKATREAFQDGWLKTGDRFYVDKDGFFFFVDRVKDTLKVSGLQVSPSEIEAVLMTHPGRLIVDVCVGGVPGGRTSDELVPRAWVVLSEDGMRRGLREVCAEMERWARANLSQYKWLRGGIGIVNEIPKNPTGKVLRRVLQERHEQELQMRKKIPQSKL